MPVELPPLAPEVLAQLEGALRRVPSRFREDAYQQAWLAYLEGKNPISAVENYATKERLHERREVPLSQL